MKYLEESGLSTQLVINAMAKFGVKVFLYGPSYKKYKYSVPSGVTLIDDAFHDDHFHVGSIKSDTTDQIIHLKEK